MTITVKKVELGSDWENVIQNFKHDVFHTHAYNLLYAKEIGGKAVLFIFFDSSLELIGAVPLIERQIDNTNMFDLTSCYGYSNILSTQSAYRGILNFLNNEFGTVFPYYVSLFLRSNPFLFESDEGSDLIYIDIANQDNDILTTYRYGHRSEIKKVSSSLIVKEVAGNDENLLIFTSIYNETMARVGASRSHLFDHKFIQEMSKQTQFGFRLIFVYHNNVIIGSCIFIWLGNIGHYFLSGSRLGYEKYIPGKVLVHKCNQISKALGLDILSLGGGLGGQNDNLSQFKRGFSKAYKKYTVKKIILQKNLYDKLSEKVLLGSETSFFPAYRFNRQQ